MIVYYIEVNLICIVVLLLFRAQLQNMRTSSTDQRILHVLIWMTVLFCLSDLLAGIFRGAQFPGARAIIELSNLVYFESITLVSFLWSAYVHVRLKKSSAHSRGFRLLWAFPLLLFTAVALSNPFTHILFQISAENLYERNVGVYLHWVIVWGYFLVPSIQTLKAYLGEPSRIKRQEIAPMLYFTVAPAVASVVQMVFYGVTSTQVGVTISIVMICLACQNTQILTDALTGINNRRGFDNHLAGSIQRNPAAIYTLVMIDIDNFKHINDKYGHITGDLVLQSIADSLKQACKTAKNHLFLCRFGGDEFVILGSDCSGNEMESLKTAIGAELLTQEKDLRLPCALTVSIGTATGACTDEAGFKALLNEADQAMYHAKKVRKTDRQPRG